MSSSDSIMAWVRRLEEGDRAGVQRLWERYFEQLVSLARHKLQGVPRQMADEEDVALSALKSFCRAVEQKRFPRLVDSGDLWQILVMLTRNKAANLRAYHLRDRRDVRRMHNPILLAAQPPSETDAFFLDLLAAEEPDPQFAAEVAEQCEQLLLLLPDEQLRQIALRKLEGYTNEEIAEQLDCAVATIERRLARIRSCWKQVATREAPEA